jgi:hypothetical protein
MIIHSSDVFYVEYPYLLLGCVFIGIGVLSAACAAMAFFGEVFYGSVFVLPSLFGFGVMVYIPDGTPHVQRSMMHDANYLSSISSFFRVWYEVHRSFPNNEVEFLDALRNGPAAWQSSHRSVTT